MDRNGIGTDATIATHISTIQQREYVIKENNKFKATKLGRALVEGYNSMGYQLNKPHLRASMEADCQKIARGQLSKNEFLKKCLEQMKECFMKCNSEASKLDIAMQKHFTVLGAGNDGYEIIKRDFSKCGVCHNKMDMRCSNTIGDEIATRFLFCITCVTPQCLPPKGELSSTEYTCPICNFQVINIKNKDTDKEHTICPYCFNNPPLPPTGIEGLNEFRLHYIVLVV